MNAPALALILAFACAGCADDARPPACTTVADCLLDEHDDPLTVFVHVSDGLALHPEAWATFTGEVRRIADRGVVLQPGSAIAPLPGELDESGLNDLHPDGLDPTALHIYVVNTTHFVGSEPASGLSFPGSAPVFLFPRMLDFRVGQAGLDASDPSRARLEAIVLVHEFGHAIGLVDCGLPMVRPHADPAAACHSANASSVMHSRVARVNEWPAWDASQPLSPFAWDADDLADLAGRRAVLAA